MKNDQHFSPRTAQPDRPLDGEELPRGISCEGGFRVLGTPIGSGGARRAPLLFLPHLDGPLPRRGHRIVITPVLAAALGVTRRGLDALSLGYDRKISLGRMDIRLLPAGIGPGTAQLELAFRERKIVFCSGVRLAAPVAGASAEIPQCELLLLDAEPAAPSPPAPRRAAADLKNWLAHNSDAEQLSVLFCGNLAAAIDAASVAQSLELPIRAVRPLSETLSRLAGMVPGLPTARCLSDNWPKSGIALLLCRNGQQPRGVVPVESRTAYVGPKNGQPACVEIAFRLGEGEDRPGLVEYAKRTGAAQVALGPCCDEPLVKLFQKAGIRVFRAQHADQMPLPF